MIEIKKIKKFFAKIRNFNLFNYVIMRKINSLINSCGLTKGFIAFNKDKIKQAEKDIEHFKIIIAANELTKSDMEKDIAKLKMICLN